MQVCFGAQAMLMFDGFACLESLRNVFCPGLGRFWSWFKGEEPALQLHFHSTLCSLGFAPDPLAARVPRMQFLSSPYCCVCIHVRISFFIEMEQDFLAVLMSFSFLKCLDIYV